MAVAPQRPVWEPSAGHKFMGPPRPHSHTSSVHITCDVPALRQPPGQSRVLSPTPGGRSRAVSQSTGTHPLCWPLPSELCHEQGPGAKRTQSTGWPSHRKAEAPDQSPCFSDQSSPSTAS